MSRHQTDIGHAFSTLRASIANTQHPLHQDIALHNGHQASGQASKHRSRRGRGLADMQQGIVTGVKNGWPPEYFPFVLVLQPDSLEYGACSTKALKGLGYNILGPKSYSTHVSGEVRLEDMKWGLPKTYRA